MSMATAGNPCLRISPLLDLDCAPTAVLPQAAATQTSPGRGESDASGYRRVSSRRSPMATSTRPSAHSPVLANQVEGEILKWGNPRFPPLTSNSWRRRESNPRKISIAPLSAPSKERACVRE
jgi:hypothetical protein